MLGGETTGPPTTVLDDVLRGAAEPAIYRVPTPTSLDDLRAATERAGWQLVHVDGTGANDRTAVLAAMASGFGFPESFDDDSLDSLADALGDVGHEHGTVLVWDASNAFGDAHPNQFNATLSVLLSRARATAGGPFLTLLRDASNADTG